MSPKRRRRRLTRLPAARYSDLASYLALSGDTQVQLARRVKSTQSHISRLAKGAIVPRPLLAERLARHAQIPLDSFVRANLAYRNGRP